jgi:hypothetical protein
VGAEECGEGSGGLCCWVRGMIDLARVLRWGCLILMLLVIWTLAGM